MKKWQFVAILVLVCCSAQALTITEIHFDPEGEDNNKEFIEVWGTSNLSGYWVGDASSNDTLTLLQYIPGNLSLIVESGFLYSQLNCSIYSAGSSIGNNLNNQGDSVFIYKEPNMTMVANATYLIDDILQGHSIEWKNNRWIASQYINGSPCQINTSSMPSNVTNSSLNLSNSTESNYTINETFNATTNQTSNEPFSCNITLELLVEKQIVGDGEQIIFYNLVNEDPFEIEYWVEDSQGLIIKEKRITTNKNKKTYTPHINELDALLWLHNRLVSPGCSNNTLHQQLPVFVVNGTPKACDVCQTCQSCPVCEVSEPTNCPKETTPVTIKSFYTRTKNLKENVTLYANIESLDNTTVYLFRGMTIINMSIPKDSKTYDFNVDVPPGTSEYLLIAQQTPYVSIERLTLERPAEKQKTEVSENNTSMPNKTFQPLIITGNIADEVYTSKNYKVTNYLKYGLVIILILSAIILVISHVRKSKYQAKNRRRMGKVINYFRNGGKTKRTHSKEPSKFSNQAQRE